MIVFEHLFIFNTLAMTKCQLLALVYFQITESTANFFFFGGRGQEREAESKQETGKQRGHFFLPSEIYLSN